MNEGYILVALKCQHYVCGLGFRNDALLYFSRMFGQLLPSA